MNNQSEKLLAHIIHTTRVATLATLREEAPRVSMVTYVAADDFSAFYLYLSRLAQHTVDMQKDRRVSLLIAESDDGRTDPQTLARGVHSRQRRDNSKRRTGLHADKRTLPCPLSRIRTAVQTRGFQLLAHQAQGREIRGWFCKSIQYYAGHPHQSFNQIILQIENDHAYFSQSSLSHILFHRILQNHLINFAQLLRHDFGFGVIVLRFHLGYKAA